MDLKALKILIGKKVVKIEQADADEGFIIVFDDGTTLDVGYSGNEGSTYLNGKRIDP